MIANPIGYPIVHPTPNPIGFRSPVPVPDTRSRFRLTSSLLLSRPIPKRRLSDVARSEQLGLAC